MTDLSNEFIAAWRRFQALDSLRLKYDTLEWEWTRGRSEYVAFLISIDDAVVRAHLRRAAGPIAAVAGAEPYPEDYWHITIKGVGFQVDPPSRDDDVSTSAVQALEEAAASVFRNKSPFQVQIGLISAFEEVVIAELWDSLPVRKLNQRLLEAIPGLLRYPFDGDLFLPHISIARFTSSEALAQLKDTLASLREEGPGPPLTIRRIDLIRAHLSAHTPTFEQLARYELRQ